MASNLLPAKARKTLYAAYALVGVVIGAVQVGFASAELGQPTWLTVTLAVFAFLGGAFGFVAGSNTTPEYPEIDNPTPYNVNPEASEYQPRYAE